MLLDVALNHGMDARTVEDSMSLADPLPIPVVHTNDITTNYHLIAYTPAGSNRRCVDEAKLCQYPTDLKIEHTVVSAASSQARDRHLVHFTTKPWDSVNSAPADSGKPLVAYVVFDIPRKGLHDNAVGYMCRTIAGFLTGLTDIDASPTPSVSMAIPESVFLGMS